MKKVERKYYLVQLAVNFNQPYFLYPVVAEEKEGKLTDVITGKRLVEKDSEECAIKYSKKILLDAETSKVLLLTSFKSDDLYDYCRKFDKMACNISGKSQNFEKFKRIFKVKKIKR